MLTGTISSFQHSFRESENSNGGQALKPAFSGDSITGLIILCRQWQLGNYWTPENTDAYLPRYVSRLANRSGSML